ncbi:uncharacterized protein CTRU02_200779 [Colletotrichum truncatum]|uniref:Uncharacterized protein n=1 Tax=Colletotrichum truncatum TaxID=5467 RepID=A0ACC3ZFJ4_COLTU|nr:uncharacterized protein CTRU02_00546 [Colletotrichum truncatum]KAF6801797.1 hypothetical protein CTRU02_00546 [Colletotrichum truncatum]
MHVFLPVVLVTFTSIVAGQGSCFVPNGTNRHALTNAGGNKYEPCEANGHSMCCNPGVGDKCQPNGLCWNPIGKVTWRESCTDPTWQSPKCIKLCASDDYIQDGVPASGMDALVTKCADGSYCCGNDKKASDCCNSGQGVRIKDEVTTSSTSSTSSLSSSSTSASSSTTSTTTTLGPLSASAPSAPAPTVSSTGSDSGTSNETGSETWSNQAGIIGAAVGAGVGAAFSVIAIWMFWYLRKRKAATSRMHVMGATQQHAAVNEDVKYKMVPTASQQYIVELSGEPHIRAELDGESVKPPSQ